MAGVTGTGKTDDAAGGDGSDGQQTRPAEASVPGENERALITRLFSARSLALGSTASDRFWSWMGPALVAALAALLRLINLGHPRTLVFDETYYVKGAYALLTAGFEAEWPEGANPSFEAGDQDIYLTYADYVVHPPVGKWMIALGMRLGGPENSWAWRLAPAIVGIIAVFLLARTARRLFGSTAFGIIAGGQIGRAHV